MSKAILNLNAWSYLELNNFIKNLVDASSEAAEEASKLARKVVVSWEYEVDLADENALDELDFGQWVSLMKQIQEDLATYLENVDFKKSFGVTFTWKKKRFNQFLRAREEGKQEVVEAMLREVVNIPGDDPNKPLRALEGAAAMKALTSAYAKVVQGKN